MSWIEETKKNIKLLKEQDYYGNWVKQKTNLFTFFICPETKLPINWIKKRVKIYESNAKKLNVTPPKINFFIYPSLEFGKQLGIVPAIAFISGKEIHGHLNQSPGHELTHILLGEVNSTENLPVHGLWSEGVCVYLDGTNTDRKKHTNSLNYRSDVLETQWQRWEENLPDNLYPLAGSIIQYLDEISDWNKFLKFLKVPAKHTPNLIEEYFNCSVEKLQQNWRNWLKKG